MRRLPRSKKGENIMSVIFTDDELTEIEALLGKDFIELYIKIWDERISVKRYQTQVKANLSVAKGHNKTYWTYKLEEIESVIANQSRWLKTILQQLSGKISDKSYRRLEDYVKANEPAAELKVKMCVRCGVNEATVGGWCSECNTLECQERKARRMEAKKTVP